MGLGQRVFVCRKGIYRVSGTVAFSYASLLVCLFFLLLTQAVFAKVPAPLTLAYLSSGKSGGERMHWQVFARVLSKNTHLNIQVRAFDKPDALAKSIKNRQIQLAILGNSATLEVIEQTQGAATIFAQIKPPLSVDGHRTEGNHALIIAHKESEIQGLDDVVVADEQKPVPDILRVIVVAEAETVVGFQPADLGLKPFVRSADVDGPFFCFVHVRSPEGDTMAMVSPSFLWCPLALSFPKFPA